MADRRLASIVDVEDWHSRLLDCSNFVDSETPCHEVITYLLPLSVTICSLDLIFYTMLTKEMNSYLKVVRW